MAITHDRGESTLSDITPAQARQQGHTGAANGAARAPARAAALEREYRDRVSAVHTTTSPSGLTLDWVAIESQIRDGRIATPPPTVAAAPAAGELHEEHARPELANGERGPDGTVPIVRPDFERLAALPGWRRLQRKYRSGALGAPALAAPQDNANHMYANSGQSITCYGGDGSFSVFDPYTEAANEFSLIQVGLSNSDLGYLQTVEAGWQEFHDLRGDWVPHLFTYFTTNGYSSDGLFQGGYNQALGWVQYDNAIFPGTTFTPYSERGGAQRKIDIKYQLWQGDWWLSVQGTWIGYYPGWLFSGIDIPLLGLHHHDKPALADHADNVGFWGEIADPASVGGATKTDMGSGYFGEAGWTWSAYMHNLRVQTDRNGGMSRYDGSGNEFSTDATKYDIVSHWDDDGSWGSYCYLGGPGAG